MPHYHHHFSFTCLSLACLFSCNGDPTGIASDTASGTTAMTMITTTEDTSTSSMTVTTTSTTTSEDTSTTATSTTTTSSTTGPDSVCGNGMPEPGEECDDGNDDNTDVCLDTCKHATCGDGFVYAGFEECDKDPNTQQFPDGCISNDCIWDKRIVFVTSMTFTGDLGGIVGADSKCAAAASGAGFGGTFRAWLSGSMGSPAKEWQSDLNGFKGKFALPDGTFVATGWNNGALVLETEISQDEHGAPVPDGYVWTGTDAKGMLQGNTCSNWGTDITGDGQSGATNDITKWTNAVQLLCGNFNRLYCFQVKQ